MSYAFQSEQKYRQASYEAYLDGSVKEFEIMCSQYRWMYPDEQYGNAQDMRESTYNPYGW